MITLTGRNKSYNKHATSASCVSCQCDLGAAALGVYYLHEILGVIAVLTLTLIWHLLSEVKLIGM